MLFLEVSIHIYFYYHVLRPLRVKQVHVLHHNFVNV